MINNLLKNRDSIFRRLDWVSVILYFIMIIFGYINLYSISSEIASKQLIWIIISIIFIFFIFLFKPTNYKNCTLYLFIITLLLLMGVFFFGKNVNGSKSWYFLGTFSFQPSEFAKVSTSLMIAKYFSYYYSHSKIKRKKKIKIFLYIMLSFVIPAILIFIQPDPGSSIVFFSFILTLYREGFPIYIILFFLFSIILFLLSINISPFFVITTLFILFFIYFVVKKKMSLIKYFFYIILFTIFSFFSLFSPYLFYNLLKHHHKNRIYILFQNEFDKKYRNNIGYNLLYSKTAIGSGQLFGKGYRKGLITRGKFVPAQHTDYIFCTIGEEWGFIGSVILIILYLFFIGRIYFLSEKQQDPFSRIFGYSVGNILLTHIGINLGMITGIFPTIGIVLPFFSYGGSSLWSFTILVFIFLRMDSYNYIS